MIDKNTEDFTPEEFLENFFKRDENGNVLSNKLGKMNFTVHQLKEMIEMELKGRGSPSALLKLYRRYSKLRGLIEWELLKQMRADWSTYLLKRKTKDWDQTKAKEAELKHQSYNIAS